MLEARRLGRRRPGQSDWLFKEVSICVQPGDRWAIVGPTGAGKTIFLRALALLDPLDEGEVLWQGRTVQPGQVPRYRSQVAYLLQRSAVGVGTVEQSLRAPLALAVHRDKRFDREQIVEQLSALGRDQDFLCQSTADLSGGERQIVALLRMLQLQPNVLLLDEPTAAMDSITARAVEQLIEQWLTSREQQLRASVWVGHDQEQITRIANKRIVMRAGRIEEVST